MRVLCLPVLEVQQLHEALHVPNHVKQRPKVNFHTLQIINFVARNDPIRKEKKPLPLLDQFDRWLADQLVRQQVDLSHGVGQPYRQLLTQEHVGCFLTGIVPA